MIENRPDVHLLHLLKHSGGLHGNKNHAASKCDSPLIGDVGL